MDEVQYPGVWLDSALMKKTPAVALTILGFLRARANEQPSRIAMSAHSYRGYRQRETFSEVLRQVERIGQWFLASSVKAGHRVAVLLPESARRESVLFGFASMSVGAVWVSLDAELPDEELASALVLTIPDVIVCLTAERGRAERIGTCATVLVMDAPGFVAPWKDWNASPRESMAMLRADAIACINLTSGTTGRAKAVVHSHQGMLSAATAIGEAAKLAACDVYQCMPAQTAGLNTVTSCLIAWISGAAVVFEGGKRSHTESLRLMEAEGTTVYHASSPAIHGVVDESLNNDYNAPQLLRVVCGGGPMSTMLQAKLHLRHPRLEVVRIWGATETGWAGVATSDAGGTPARAGAGFPMTGCQLRIVDREGRAVISGNLGEIAVRGPGNAVGYLSDLLNDQATAREAWVRTGDLGYLDASGQLHFVDRLSDAVHGASASSIHVEDVIHRFPGVADVAVVEVRHGTRDPSAGVAACVVFDGKFASDRQELAAFCAARLAPQQRPRFWYLMDALPKSAHGKVLKRRLRESVAHLSPAS